MLLECSYATSPFPFHLRFCLLWSNGQLRSEFLITWTWPWTRVSPTVRSSFEDSIGSETTRPSLNSLAIKFMWTTRTSSSGVRITLASWVPGFRLRKTIKAGISCLESLHSYLHNQRSQRAFQTSNKPPKYYNNEVFYPRSRLHPVLCPRDDRWLRQWLWHWYQLPCQRRLLQRCQWSPDQGIYHLQLPPHLPEHLII